MLSSFGSDRFSRSALDRSSGAGVAAWRSVRRYSGLAVDGGTKRADLVGRMNGHRDTFARGSAASRRRRLRWAFAIASGAIFPANRWTEEFPAYDRTQSKVQPESTGAVADLATNWGLSRVRGEVRLLPDHRVAGAGRSRRSGGDGSGDVGPLRWLVPANARAETCATACRPPASPRGRERRHHMSFPCQAGEQ